MVVQEANGSTGLDYQEVDLYIHFGPSKQRDLIFFLLWVLVVQKRALCSELFLQLRGVNPVQIFEKD